MSVRLPAQLEATGLIRLAEAQGGFGAVLARGEREAGTLLLALIGRGGGAARLFERMPRPDGAREWREIAAGRASSAADARSAEAETGAYLARRRAQDPDMWIIELTVADCERFVSELPPPG